MTTPTSNAKRFIHSNPTRKNRTARAPYNFVPLPDKIITIKGELPPLNRYEGHTGWFECELETCSPTYVRGMMTLEQFERYDPRAERKLSKDPQTRSKHIKLKEERARFYSAHLDDPERAINGLPIPAIPGSSLRGMIRSLIEVAGYGKMRWVSSTSKVTYRAVAAAREDPLAEPYRQKIGQFSRNVLAGYWSRKGDSGWEIQPAVRPQNKGWSERAAYLKVKEAKILSGAISDFHRFDDKDYWPGSFRVSFSASNERGRQGSYVRINQIGDEAKGYPHKGALVCTGNMIEGANRDPRKRSQKSPRRNHALVLERDPNAKRLPVSEELWDEYKDSLTPFQRDELPTEGGREDGSPVFYVADKGAVVWFGHTPNFRIPALNAAGRAATPLDFVPSEVRNHFEPDLAEAMFGWVEEREPRGKVSQNLKGQMSGRVSFTDADCVPAQTEIWYSPTPIAPSTLGGPKITTFQHYLVQDKGEKHDPDFRQTLAHYNHKGETEIRGYKYYWHKGNIRISVASESDSESQLTRIIPIKAGVRFKFRVHFENLRDFELGSLAWALTLPTDDNKTYRHKLGMGKPLGMGSVKLKANLFLTNRSERYAKLFSDGKLADAANASDTTEFLTAFAEFVRGGVELDNQQERIRTLLAMLQWREPTTDWLDATRYLSIQHPQNDNEYKDRPVLPEPLIVSGEQ